jgi:hypothetical protein
MSSQINRYLVKLSLVGLPEEQYPAVIADLREEFDMRPYVQNLQISQESKINGLLIQSIEEAHDPEQAASLLVESLHDAVSAIIEQPTGLHIEIVDVARLE